MQSSSCLSGEAELLMETLKPAYIRELTAWITVAGSRMRLARLPPEVGAVVGSGDKTARSANGARRESTGWADVKSRDGSLEID